VDILGFMQQRGGEGGVFGADKMLVKNLKGTVDYI